MRNPIAARPLPSPRPLFVAVALGAALATAAPMVGSDPGARGATRAVEPLAQGGPLEGGAWETIANGDRVNHITRDGDVLWSATDGGGLVRWDLTTDTPTQYLYPQDGLASNVIHDIARMPDGTLYLATERALTHFDPVTEAFTNIVPGAPATDPPMPSRVVRALALRPDGKLWVGFGQEWDAVLMHPRADGPGAFRPGGLALYDPASGTWSRELHPVVSDGNFRTIPSENITSIAYGTDGLLWIGTEPFYTFEEDANCGDGVACIDAWVLAGGGLAGTDLDAGAGGAFTPDRTLAEAAWIVYRPADKDGGGSAKATACMSNHITQLHADVEGRMWAASIDRGLVLVPYGLRKTTCSSNGLPFYTRVSTGGKPETRVDGLRGRNVFAIDIDPDGHVWIAHGDGRDEGEGIAVLDHKNTFHDSSANEEPWATTIDDAWDFITFDGTESGPTDAVITALLVDDDGQTAYMGTTSYKYGDGYGLRRLQKENGAWTRWTPLTTAASGLPSNHVVDVKQDPSNGAVWFATERRGVARRAADGTWRTWHAFGQGPKVATALEYTSNRFSQLVVDIPTLEAYNLIFTAPINYIRIGDDPTRYRARRWRPAVGGRGPWIEFFPQLKRDVAVGTPIYLMDRGPAGDMSSQIAFADRRTFVGGRESIYLPQNECPEPPECWLDGGLGAFEDGAGWNVWPQTTTGQPDGTGVTDQEVGTVETDLSGRVWAGTGRQSKSEGDGISVYDPATDRFTYHRIPEIGSGGAKYAGNGIADLSVDPQTGNMWAAHFPARRINEALDGTRSEVIHGGGVSLWNGTDWSFWRKDRGALLRGYGNGTFGAVLADRANGRVWVGGWDALPRRFHWGEGRGVNAALNWCPIDACTNEAWKAEVWDEEGEVNALAVDPRGHVWVGTGRRGLAMLPPAGGTSAWTGPTRAGLRIWDGASWHAYAPDNVPIAEIEVQAISSAGDSMWIGTRSRGISHFWFTPPVTPTPKPTRTPLSTPTPTATPSIEATPTRSNVTPATPTPTTRPTRTPSPAVGCHSPNFPGWCEVYIPFTGATGAWCRVRPCIPSASDPTPIRATATSAAPTATRPPTTAPPPSATATLVAPSATPTVGTAAPSATAGPSATGGPPAASATPTSTPVAPTAPATATRTATPSPSPSPTRTATSTAARVGTWTNFNRTRTITSQNLRGVDGVQLDQVILVGDSSTVLIWDGARMTSGTITPGRNLVDVAMSDARTGYAVGNMSGQSGSLFRTRNGGQSWSNMVTNIVDDWISVGLAPGNSSRGWVVGGGRGVRLLFDGSNWNTQGPADANNSAHKYTDVAFAGDDTAFVLQDGTAGARMYRWDGTQWLPDAVTGGLFALDIASPTSGIAVGDGGNAWRLDASGAWERFPDKPRTANRDLFGVAMVAPDLIWAVGERGALWLWNGTTWSQETVSGVSADLYDVWIDPSGLTGFAVGDAGTILRYEVTP